ncbi:putative S-adenosyl-L-methionine-dependent methyltransferase [Helianthus annuus]|nr:putative S-adenosyl-L-methionine-dependent methyltransferase [Helianthus annuus]
MELKDHNQGRLRDQISKVVTVVIILVLCHFSFYLGGLFCSMKYEFVTKEIAKSIESSEMTLSSSVQVEFVSFPQCSAKLQDYTPCTDPKVLRLVE